MRVFLVFLFLSGSVALFSQSPGLNAALKMKLAEKKLPGEKYSILVQGDISKLRAFEKQAGYSIYYSSGNIASISCDANSLSFLIDNKIISHAELTQSRVKPMNDTMVYRNRIKPVKIGAAPLTQAYDGSGIVIGFIDTGIDIAHKDFKDAQGNSRIKFLWDQVATAGSTAPLPFNYGIEWTAAQINASLCTHSDMAHYGHGTHVAGIAAGNGLSNNTHEGCAPKADIVVVAIDFNKAGPVTADAVQYIFDKATLLNKPCVINASLGDYYGSHDATDLEAKLIESMLVNTPGRALVAAAGNAGNSKFHVKTQSTPATDTSFTWLANGTTSFDYWFYGDTTQVKNLQISVGANRSNFSDLGRIPFKNYNYGLISVKHDTLKKNGNRIGVIYNSSSINSYGVYELYIHIAADTSNLLWRIETKGTGMHHAWNFDFMSAGLPTQSQYPRMVHYLIPDSMYSMVSSYQNSEEVITVANYVNLNSYYDVHDSLRHLAQTTGALAYSSSSGPTRDGRQKPDIATTGESVFSTLVTGMQANLITNYPQVVAQGSFHVKGGGTSASAPVVTGLAALYMQAHPEATNQQVKAAITNCAYTDGFTGTVPNYAWGYGKLDGLATMTCGENLAGISKNNGKGSAVCFPNPFKDKVTLVLPSKTKGKISVYSAEGKLIFEDTIDGDDYELNFSRIKNNNPGLYFVRINGRENTYAFKLIRE